MKKTPHFYAVTLAHERIEYGDFLRAQPDLLDALKRAIFEASKQVIDEAIASKQAEIDRLMLEYCPEEMTPEQIENWKRHQVPAGPEAIEALNATIDSRAPSK